MMGIKRILFPDDIIRPTTTTTSRKRPLLGLGGGGGNGVSAGDCLANTLNPTIQPRQPLRQRRDKRQRDNNNNINSRRKHQQQQDGSSSSSLLSRGSVLMNLSNAPKPSSSSSSSSSSPAEKKTTSNNKNKKRFVPTDSLGGLESSTVSLENHQQQLSSSSSNTKNNNAKKKVKPFTETQTMDSLLGSSLLSSSSAAAALPSSSSSSSSSFRKDKSKTKLSKNNSKVPVHKAGRISKHSEKYLRGLRNGSNRQNMRVSAATNSSKSKNDNNYSSMNNNMMMMTTMDSLHVRTEESSSVVMRNNKNNKLESSGSEKRGFHVEEMSILATMGQENSNVNKHAAKVTSPSKKGLGPKNTNHVHKDKSRSKPSNPVAKTKTTIPTKIGSGLSSMFGVLATTTNLMSTSSNSRQPPKKQHTLAGLQQQSSCSAKERKNHDVKETQEVVETGQPSSSSDSSDMPERSTIAPNNEDLSLRNNELAASNAPDDKTRAPASNSSTSGSKVENLEANTKTTTTISPSKASRLSSDEKNTVGARLAKEPERSTLKGTQSTNFATNTNAESLVASMTASRTRRSTRLSGDKSAVAKIVQADSIIRTTTTPSSQTSKKKQSAQLNKSTLFDSTLVSDLEFATSPKAKEKNLESTNAKRIITRSAKRSPEVKIPDSTVVSDLEFAFSPNADENMASTSESRIRRSRRLSSDNNNSLASSQGDDRIRTTHSKEKQSGKLKNQSTELGSTVVSNLEFAAKTKNEENLESSTKGKRVARSGKRLAQSNQSTLLLDSTVVSGLEFATDKLEESMNTTRSTRSRKWSAQPSQSSLLLDSTVVSDLDLSVTIKSGNLESTRARRSKRLSSDKTCVTTGRPSETKKTTTNGKRSTKTKQSTSFDSTVVSDLEVALSPNSAKARRSRRLSRDKSPVARSQRRSVERGSKRQGEAGRQTLEDEDYVESPEVLRRSKRKSIQPNRLSMSPEKKRLRESDVSEKSTAKSTDASPNKTKATRSKRKSAGVAKKASKVNSRSLVPPKEQALEEKSKLAADVASDGSNDEWTETELGQLRQAHQVIDPRSVSFWEDVSEIVNGKSSAQCREQWFSAINTPKIPTRRGKKSKAAPANDVVDDDIFDATPMKALFATMGSDDSFALLGQMGDLPDFDFGSAIKVGRESLGSTTRPPRTGYKTYIKTMRRGVNKGSKARPKNLPKGRKPKSNKNVSANAANGDVQLSGRMSPGGTVHVKSNYTQSDDEPDYMDYSESEFE